MSIVASIYTVGVPQADGRCYVTELHTDHLGAVHRIDYGPVRVLDYGQVLARNAAQLAAQLVESEADAAFAGGPMRLQQQTSAELAVRFRARFRESTGVECARLVSWLLERIAAGDLTDAQVRAAFGLTLAQYTNMKTRMSALRDQWLAVSGAGGE